METEEGALVRYCIKVELCIAHPETNAWWEFAYETSVSVQTEWWLPAASNGESGMLFSFHPPGEQLCILQNPQEIITSFEAVPVSLRVSAPRLLSHFICKSPLQGGTLSSTFLVLESASSGYSASVEFICEWIAQLLGLTGLKAL